MQMQYKIGDKRSQRIHPLNTAQDKPQGRLEQGGQNIHP